MFKRGFKAQCERRAIEIRKQLNIAEHAPLDSFVFARHLNVIIKSASDIPGVSRQDINQLTVTDPDSWSAFTIKIGDNHLIVYNPAQSKPRINSVAMHELAHITLGHDLADGHTTEHGFFAPSHYNQDQEDEADWLGSAFLLPRPALLLIRENSWDNRTAANHYNVSIEMLIWRFRMTGVDIQLQHSKRKILT